jgi:alpha-maltose-1-phosphate synthase
VVDGETGFSIPTAMPEPGQGLPFALRYLAENDNYDQYIGNVSQCTAVDVPAAAAACVRLIQDSNLRRRLGEAGRRRARRVFDWSVVVGRYQALWHELRELRRAAKPRATRPYPLRDDPFRVFRAFPSMAIGSATEVEALVPEPAKEAARIAASTMNTLALPFLLGRDEFQRLLAALPPGKRLAVAELEALFPPERKGTLIRSLAWLAKGAIVGLRAK